MKAVETINEVFGETPYKILVEEIKDFAIFHIDLEGRIISWNQGAETIFGYSKDAIIGQALFTIFRPEDQAEGIPERELKTAAETGRAEDTRWHLRKDGSRFYANGATTALRDKSGKLLGYAKVARDITEHKRAEDRMRESEEFNRNILEQSPLGIQVISPDGYTIRVNKAWEELWGITLEQIEGYNLFEDEQLIKKGVMPYIKRAFAGQATDIPPVLYDPGETIPDITSHLEPKRWTKSVIYPIKNPDGEVQEVVLMHEDITAQKQAEELLVNSQNQLRLITDAMPARISYIDSEQCYKFANEGYNKWFGLAPENIIGKHLRDVIGEGAYQSILPEVEAVLSGHEQKFERLLDYTGIQQFVDSTFIPHWDDTGEVKGFFVLAIDITKRKQAEEKLRASEQQLRAIYDGTHEYIGLLTPDGTLLEANRAALEYGKKQRDEVIGLPFWETIWFKFTPFAPEAMRQAIRQAAKGEFVRWESPLINSSGETMWFDISLYPIRNEKGEVILIVPEGRDITERKQAEEALRVSEARYRNLLENANDIIYSHDLQGNYVSVNGAAETLTGYSLEELKNMNITELVVPEQHELVRQVIEKKLYDSTPTVYEFDIITKDGHRRTLEVNPKVSIIEGKPLAIEGVARDVTGRKQTEERLRESEERLRLATGAAQMYSWEIDVNTQEVKYSENAVAPLKSDVFPENLEEVLKIVHPEDREGLSQKINQAISKAGSFTHQFRTIDSANKINWFEAHAITVRDAQYKAVRFIGITQIITERKQAEEIRQTWAERLEAARADERRHLARQLHDNIVQQLAVASIKLGQLEEKLVQLLVGEEEALLANIVVIQELLSRNQESLREMAHTLHSGILEHFGLAEALRRFTNDVGILSKEHSTTLSLDLSPEVPRLELAIENGIYYIAKEAIINALNHARAKLISISLDIRDDSVFVVIRDDGCGFNLKKIKGNGIGLAGMHERSNLISAKIDVTSQTGRGTTITLKVPLEKNRRGGQELSQAHQLDIESI